ncbi:MULTISPECIES: DUF2730 family protein [Labrys]|uniref:DUF2730 family protein n=1 Tax=Labrys neptuniae TaxID=376174 RepID=A0ABV3PGG9_9HYPH|nr:DUF2730 family protein [Labrys sp. WJW]OCC01732.1 hypothetical protein BA190_27615 [Labrys sp. WJW]
MDLASTQSAISIVLGILTIISLIYTWVTSRSRASAAEIGKIHDRVDLLEVRLTKIETEMLHLPSASGFHRMELAMTRLQGDMEVLTERLKPIGAVGDRLQEFLLDQANKR